MRWYSHRYHTPLSLRIVFAVIPRLPRFVHPAIAMVTAAIFYVLLRNERRAVTRNLRVMTGKSGPGLLRAAYMVFYNFCDFVVSYCYVPNADFDGLESMLSDPDHGSDRIGACLQGGRGVVLWTAHVANWEVASRLLECHGRRINIARLVERGNLAEMQLRDLMSNERLRVVDLSDPAATIQLLAALRGGEIVAMQGDRVYRGPGVEVPFFGRPTAFPSGPFVLAHAAGVPVLPGLVLRTGWLRYRVMIHHPIHVDPFLPRDVAVREALATAVGVLEAHLRQWPSQWLNFYDFWPEEGRG